MRPIVLKVDENGTLLITPEEIQKMLDDAYAAGYSDGKGSVSQIITHPYPVYPTWLNTPDWDFTKITCSTKEETT